MTFDFDDDDFVVPSFNADMTDESEIIQPEIEAPQVPVEITEPIHVDEMTDADIDSVFSDITSMIETDEEVIAANAAVMAAEYEITQIEANVENARQEYDALTAERLKIEAMLAEITRKQAEFHRIAMGVNSTKRSLEVKKNEAQRLLDVAKRNVQVKIERQKERKSFLEIAKGKKWYEGIQTVDGNTIKIMAHQWVGAEFLAVAGGALLGDGMGTGKTLTAIAALDLAQSNRALVVAQSEITGGFLNEFRSWAPHRTVVNLNGMSKEQRNQMLSMCGMLDNVVVIINFEAWRKDLTLIERLISVGFDTMIVDEAHNIKTTATVAYKGIYDIATRVNTCPICNVVMPELIDANGTVLKGRARMCTACGWSGSSWDIEGDFANYSEEDRARYYRLRSIKNVWCTTGTPILNKPQDLFAILSIMDPINFVTAASFLRSYCEQDIYTGKWRFREGGADRLLNKKLSGRYLARTMEDAGIILPPQYPVVHSIELDKDRYPDQWEVIRQLTHHSQIVLSNGKSMKALAQIAVITRQRQANVWPGGISWTEIDDLTGFETLVKVSESITESVKMDKALEIIIESAERGERVVLFSQFKSALVELNNRINGVMLDSGKVLSAVRYDGDTPKDKREEIKNNWDKKMGAPAKWDVLLAQYRLGGTGLNLTNARRTIILDEEWNPGKRDQAYARTRRIGQDETTFIDVLRVEHTVDNWLATLIQEKQNLIEGFNESALDMQEEWLKAFNTGEFGEFGKA